MKGLKIVPQMTVPKAAWRRWQLDLLESWGGHGEQRRLPVLQSHQGWLEPGSST